ncbi:response regulator [Terriglobus roseus]|uniref:Two component transcriptional regulator, LuxR family n=1 Tax=Terriglobus roseus TaxID=392734 RepID=A0A1H4JA03_9BACT|nr:response regulator transcription factor [Terriglobus roseus]SEB43093.1 two component transcriptional regulator, LuxR family [Terriglobus roseus]
MSKEIRVLVADDHPLMRSGIAAEINAEPDMSVIASAEDGEEALELFRVHRPDVSLIDLRMPKMNGLELLSAIRADFPLARLVVLTTSAGDVHAVRAFRMGAAGYLLKHMLRGDLITTIREVHEGRRRIPDEIAQLLAQHAMDNQMTPREIDVLSKVALGKSNKMIGAELSISEHTVKAHLKMILSKLGASDRTHAVTIATQRGFLDF